MHERLLRRELDTLQGGELRPQIRLAAFIMKAPSLVRGCSTFVTWLFNLISSVAHAVDTHLESMFEYDVLRDTLPMTTSRGHKRRLDEDTKSALARDVLQKKRAANVAAWAAGQDVPKSSANEWRDLCGADDFTSTWTIFSTCSCLHIAADGAKLGEPAKEYLCGVAWSPHHKVGAFLRPQAGILGYIYGFRRGFTFWGHFSFDRSKHTVVPQAWRLQCVSC